MDTKKSSSVRALMLVGIPVIIMFLALAAMSLSSILRTARIPQNIPYPALDMPEVLSVYPTLEECTQHTKTTMKCVFEHGGWKLIPGNHP
jgi:hypothetical protein